MRIGVSLLRALVDKDGKVIGVVLRKSASENLNFAAPISLVLSGSKSEATLGGRATYRLPMMDASENIDIHSSISLPKAPADFYAALVKEETNIFSNGIDSVLTKNADHLFPHGENSLQLLHALLTSPFPRVVREKQDKVWAAMVPSNIQKGAARQQWPGGLWRSIDPPARA